MQFKHHARIDGVSYSAGDPIPEKYQKMFAGDEMPGVAPNMGQTNIPHIYTFSGFFSNLAKAYRSADEAVRDNVYNADRMTRDPMIMGPLHTRQLMVALLDWKITHPDEKNARMNAVKDKLKTMLESIPKFTEFKRNLGEAVFFGRYGIQLKYTNVWKDGKLERHIGGWTPVHGDKLIFRFDDGSGEYDPDQVGVRVNTQIGTQIGMRSFAVDYSQEGPVAFLEGEDRHRFVVHKHFISDGSFVDSQSAGMIHGVGVRHFLYWVWIQKQETLAQLAELVERTAMGFTVYFYPSGNDAALVKVKEIAKDQATKNQIFLPYEHGNPDAYRIEQIPGNTAGIAALSSLLDNYFGDWIIRFILGQTLSMRADATGLGSGLADLHRESLANIIRYDALNMQETITTDVVKPLLIYNFPSLVDEPFKFEFVIPDTQHLEQKLGAMQAMWSMGAKIKASEAMEIAGLSAPGPDDEVMMNPQFAQMEQQQKMQEQQAEQAAQTNPLEQLQSKYGPMMQAKRYSKAGDVIREALEKMPITIKRLDADYLLADDTKLKCCKCGDQVHLAADKYSAYVDRDLKVRMTRGDYLGLDPKDMRKLQEAARSVYDEEDEKKKSEAYAEPKPVDFSSFVMPDEPVERYGLGSVTFQPKSNPLTAVLPRGNQSAPVAGEIAKVGGMAIGALSAKTPRQAEAPQPAEIGIENPLKQYGRDEMQPIVDKLPVSRSEDWGENGSKMEYHPVPFPMITRRVESPSGKEIKSAEIVTVPLDQLHATQPEVSRKGLLEDDNNEHGLPLVVKSNGILYIQDGHHRLSKRKLSGETDAPVRLVNMEKPAKQYAKHPVNDNAEELIKRAVENFGVTDVPELAGYVLPDGRMLDFSDGGNFRAADHRSIENVYDENPYDEAKIHGARTRNMLHFMGTTGAMRYFPEANAVQVAGKLTRRQKNWVSQRASESDEPMHWDTTDHTTGNNIQSGEGHHELFDHLDQVPWWNKEQNQAAGEPIKYDEGEPRPPQFGEAEDVAVEEMPRGKRLEDLGVDTFAPETPKVEPKVTPKPVPQEEKSLISDLEIAPEADVPLRPSSTKPINSTGEALGIPEPEKTAQDLIGEPQPTDVDMKPEVESPEVKAEADKAIEETQPDANVPQDLPTARTDNQTVKPGEAGWKAWGRLAHLLPEGHQIDGWVRVGKPDGSKVWQKQGSGGVVTEEATDNQMRAALMSPLGKPNDLGIRRSAAMMDGIKNQIQMQRSLTNRKQAFAAKWGIDGYSHLDDPTPEDMAKLNGFIMGFAKKHGFDSSTYPTQSHAMNGALNFAEDKTEQFGKMIAEATKHGFKPTGDFATDAAGSISHVMQSAIGRGYQLDPKKEFVDQVEDAARHIEKSQADEKDKDWLGKMLAGFGGPKGLAAMAMLLAALYSFHQMTRKR